MSNDTKRDMQSSGFEMRWVGVLGLLVGVAWIWPYSPETIVDRVSDGRWALTWLPTLVLMSAAAGWFVRSRWMTLLAPLVLYLGGAIRWFQFEHGWRTPEWSPFLTGSAIAFGTLLLVAGTSAGIAARTISAESQAIGRPVRGIRLPAAFAALLGLLAMTAFVHFPLPYLGGLLGFAAVLSGIGVLQEGATNGWERSLAAAGITAGSAITVVEIYELWGIVDRIVSLS